MIRAGQAGRDHRLTKQRGGTEAGIEPRSLPSERGMRPETDTIGAPNPNPAASSLVMIRVGFDTTREDLRGELDEILGMQDACTATEPSTAVTATQK